MKRLKALIKVEIKPALLIGILFLVANLLGFLQIQGRINGMWRTYLNGGLTGYFDWNGLINIIGGTLFEASFIVGILYMVLLIALVFASFRYEKSVEISRFLKSLPYTERERCLVKISVGVAVSAIGMLVYMVCLLYLRHYSIGLFKEIIEVTSLGSIVEEIFNLGKLLKMLALTYVVLIAGYLFMMMVQYMVSNRLAGIVIGILSAMAPLFIVQAFMDVFELSWHSWIGRVVDGLTYLMVFFTGYVNLFSLSPDTYYGSYTYLSGFGYHMAFYVAIIVLIVIVILYFTKTNRLENSDLLMPHPVVRIIFMIGVSVCGGLSSCYILRAFFGSILFTAPIVPTIVLFIVGMMISFFIAKKIAYIGIKKRKEVKA